MKIGHLKPKNKAIRKVYELLKRDNNKKFLLNLFKEMMFQQKDIN